MLEIISVCQEFTQRATPACFVSFVEMKFSYLLTVQVIKVRKER